MVIIIYILVLQIYHNRHKRVDKLKITIHTLVQEGSENINQYQIFNDNGVGYFTNNENGLKTRQNFVAYTSR